MIASFGLLIIIILSIIVVRIGAISLELTGLSPEIASFQAQSAFSGVGFTTVESEAIVTHPVRRRIIRVLILFGSAGVTTSMATLVLTFVGQSGTSVLLRGSILVSGLAIIFLVARSRYIYRVMKKIITKALKKWTRLKIFDYEQMFGLGEGYALSKVTVSPGSFFEDKKIKAIGHELRDVLILAIYRRNGRKIELIGAPHGETHIMPGDELICYAKESALDEAFSK